MDVLISFPDLLLALAMIAVLGPGLVNAMIAVGIAFIPGFARLTRSSVLSIREQNYVEAARALGASDAAILLNHLLPNSLRPLLVLTTLASAPRSSRARPCVSWAWARSRRRRSGGRCSMPGRSLCVRPGG